MHVAVLGCGQMGRAAAFALAGRADVQRVTLVDRDGDAAFSLARSVGQKARAVEADASDRGVLDDVDAIAVALPWDATVCATRLGRPLAAIARPHQPALPALDERARMLGVPLVLGCGLEPGLTEILARATIDVAPGADEVHVRCGGVPADPRPPLGYTLTFGSRLSIAPRPAYAIEHGRLRTVARFSGVESVRIEGLGELEAHHDGMLPWLRLPGVRTMTQKTLRWSGFAAHVGTLAQLGLLGEDAVDVDGHAVPPRAVVDAVLAPHVRRREDDRDVVVVDVEARTDGEPVRRATLIDRFDERTGLSAMARTTGFTLAAATAQLPALRPGCRDAHDLSRESLLADLATHGIHVNWSSDA